jgi:methyltransferase OMS1, mitochondrial
MGQIKTANVANPNHSSYGTDVKRSVLLFSIYAYGLLLRLVIIAITVHHIGALSIAPIETSLQRHDIDCERHERYDRENIPRRDVLDRMRCSSFLSLFVGSASLFPNSCHALTPTEAQTKYDSYASSYDDIDGGIASELLGLDTARKLLIQQAAGKVLEVGVGTGLNLQYYNSDQITSLDVVDISSGMLQEAMKKVSTLPNLQNVPINFIKADMTTQLVEKFGLESFDTVVDTFSMCVLGDEGAQKCLDQMSRVVRREGGQILLLENSRSSNPLLGQYQDVTADSAAVVGGRGCKYNQNIRQLIQSSNHVRIVDETEFATGLFRSFRCERKV